MPVLHGRKIIVFQVFTCHFASFAHASLAQSHMFDSEAAAQVSGAAETVDYFG